MNLITLPPEVPTAFAWATARPDSERASVIAASIDVDTYIWTDRSLISEPPEDWDPEAFSLYIDAFMIGIR